MRKLYRFAADFGRMGRLSGIFSADEKDIENSIGKTVNFGEVLGKHSEIVLNITNDDFTEITGDQEFIDKFEQYNCSMGHNPLEYLEIK